ncbi:hypothetical protein HanXRQr2_Chr11g0511811 [Helianthus annuus]|uniref:Uncharacterized protein n=1 Tax=Helianthus annuus TaxID=4232 RepID=A0A9K3HTB6_HELAN|nr:hypothetical protein HanXRQr2_Chr11g0511811 [Helianthus annuus]KAJ0876855.1 hypothetical protein HanPSC8_Chr11g0493201 [Helianthus annuus]
MLHPISILAINNEDIDELVSYYFFKLVFFKAYLCWLDDLCSTLYKLQQLEEFCS